MCLHADGTRRANGPTGDGRAALLVGDDHALGGAQLEDAVARTARRLVARGVGAGCRVAVALPAGLDFALIVRALPRLAAVLVPLDPRASAIERGELAAQCDARVLVDEPLEGPEAAADPAAEPDPDSLRTILFTSGTTARRRAVALTHANHAASARASALHLGVRPNDRWLCCLPVHHVGGLSVLLRAERDGAGVEIHPRFDAASVLGALTGGKVTLVSLVPTMLRRLVDAGLGPVPGLRAALVGGADVPRDLLAWAAQTGFPLLATYGMTETASQIVTASVVDARDRAGGAVGRPLEGVELRIGRGGEILVRGPMVAASAIDPDGWLHTGDRGRLVPDGRLIVEGRMDDTILTGGENVAPTEVEAALLAHPAVVDAGVVGIPDRVWGEAVTAYVVLAADVGEVELIDHCRSRLAPHAVPKVVRRAAELPRTANGKLQRFRLVG